jgi:hypothetical protein
LASFSAALGSKRLGDSRLLMIDQMVCREKPKDVGGGQTCVVVAQGFWSLARPSTREQPADCLWIVGDKHLVNWKSK